MKSIILVTLLVLLFFPSSLLFLHLEASHPLVPRQSVSLKMTPRRLIYAPKSEVGLSRSQKVKENGCRLNSSGGEILVALCNHMAHQIFPRVNIWSVWLDWTYMSGQMRLGRLDTWLEFKSRNWFSCFSGWIWVPCGHFSSPFASKPHSLLLPYIQSSSIGCFASKSSKPAFKTSPISVQTRRFGIAQCLLAAAIARTTSSTFRVFSFISLISATKADRQKDRKDI